MPYIYKIIFFIALIWNFIYLFSYGNYERKKGNFLGFIGVCLILSAVVGLFLLNCITF